MSLPREALEVAIQGGLEGSWGLGLLGESRGTKGLGFRV